MKYEVKLFVQTTEIYIVEANNQDAAEDAAVARFRNGEEADVPQGDLRIRDIDSEPFEEEITNG